MKNIILKNIVTSKFIIILLLFCIYQNGYTQTNNNEENCELISNTNFDNDLSYWDYWGCDAASVNGVASVTAIVDGQEGWETSLYAGNILIEQGENYEIKFTIWADASRTVELKIGQNDREFLNYYLDNIDLSSNRLEYSENFTMEDPTDINTAFNFFIGGNTTNIYVDNVSLVKTNCNSGCTQQGQNCNDDNECTNGETIDADCNCTGGIVVPGCAPCRQTDSLALIGIYNSINNLSTRWDITQPINTWSGITLNANGCVDAIKLDELLLSGTIATEIGELSEITSIDLEENNLTGQIPSSIGNLTTLRSLSLSENNLEENIPPSIGNLTNLSTLYLNQNNLTNLIPSSFRNLSQLKRLSLSANQLNGCYDNGLNILCDQLEILYSRNSIISDGNNFDATWEDFCENWSGACLPPIDITAPNESYTFAPGNPVDIEWTSYLTENVLIEMQSTGSSAPYIVSSSMINDGSFSFIIPPNVPDGQYRIYIESATNSAINNYSEYFTIQNPTSPCSDGIQNGGETGIDCGGSDCPDCQSDLMITVCGQAIISGNQLRVQSIRIKNDGTATAPFSLMGIYISRNSFISRSDQLVTTEGVPSIEPGQSRTEVKTIDLSTLTPPLEPGTYYVGYILDHSYAIDEISEANNIGCSLEFTISSSGDTKLSQIKTIQTNNYPNPFETNTTIEFDLLVQSKISLKVYNSKGKQITVLVDNVTLDKGKNKVYFDGSNYPSGIYYYTIQAGDVIETQKMSLIR